MDGTRGSWGGKKGWGGLIDRACERNQGSQQKQLAHKEHVKKGK